MIRYENECVGCPKEIGCLGDSCPNISVPHLYCDDCGEELNFERSSYDDYVFNAFVYKEKHYCLECLLEKVGAISFYDYNE